MSNIWEMLVNSLSPSQDELARSKAMIDDAASLPVMAGDPGLSPATSLAGLVMTPRNAAKIQTMLGGAGEALNASGALRYFATKYPKLFGLASSKPATGLAEIFNRRFVPIAERARGEYYPASHSITIYNKPTGVQRTGRELMETVGHEFTHAYRDRGGQLRDLVHNISDTASNARNVEEGFARRGGATARKTYEKFLDLLRNIE